MYKTTHQYSSVTMEFFDKHLKPFGLTFFCFGRMYYSGDLWMLTNVPMVYDYIAKNQLKPISDFPDDIISKQFIYKIPVDGYYSDLLKFSWDLDLSNPVDFMETKEDFCQFSLFALSRKISDVENFYYNHMPVLWTASKVFQETHADIIKKLDESKDNYRLDLELCSNLLNKSQKNEQTPKEKFIKNHFSLTNREMACLFYLAQGYSAKHIADSLGISAKTVEYHISNLKLKMNVKNRNVKNRKEILHYYHSAVRI